VTRNQFSPLENRDQLQPFKLVVQLRRQDGQLQSEIQGDGRQNIRISVTHCIVCVIHVTCACHILLRLKWMLCEPGQELERGRSRTVIIFNVRSPHSSSGTCVPWLLWWSGWPSIHPFLATSLSVLLPSTSSHLALSSPRTSAAPTAPQPRQYCPSGSPERPCCTCCCRSRASRRRAEW
jgi:hypothetical protein